MNLTLDVPAATPGTGFSAGPTQRPRKCMSGIGFVKAIWLDEARAQGLFPTPRSYLVASAIAKICDADGRWCFMHLQTLARASGTGMSKRTVQRALEELIEAKIVRKLDAQQNRVFFWRRLSSQWHWAAHMPCVLELCIPARDFPQAQLEQINQVRRELGEELLDETTRPRLYPAPRKERRPRPKQAPAPGSNRADQDTATPTPDIAESSYSTTESSEGGHCDITPWTKCPPDPSSNDLSSPGADTSVRGTCTTGRRAHALIARIPDALLNNPAGDRDLLSRAVEALAGHGLDEQQLTALLSGADQLRKPFPGLMSRLSSPQRALTFLAGRLGRGTDPAWPATGPPPPAWPEYPEYEDAGFVLDGQGRAARTCPDHPGVRNTPGGTCRVCARPCRTEPDQPPPEPAPPAGARTEETTPQAAEPDPEPDCEADPELARLMLQSLDQAGKAKTGEPAGTEAPLRHPPARQATIDDLRRRLSRDQGPQRPEPTTATSPPPVPPPRPPHSSNTPAPGTEPDPTGMPLPGPAPAGTRTGHDPRPHTSPQEPSMNTHPTGAPHVRAPRHEPAGNTRPAAPTAAQTATVAAAALLALPLAPAAPAPAAAAAQDTYADYAELAANETEGTDYRRTTRDGATDVAHIAIHGGGIERPTTELADHAAQEGEHAFATFEGIKPTGNSILHITSTNFDEPGTVDIVEESDFTVSWHGAAGQEPATYVGGLDTDLRDSVRQELREAGFQAPDQIPDHLKGQSPDNITNRNASGQGVQLEITRAQRDAFTDQDRTPTEAFEDYTAAVERAVDQR